MPIGNVWISHTRLSIRRSSVFPDRGKDESQTIIREPLARHSEKAERPRAVQHSCRPAPAEYSPKNLCFPFFQQIPDNNSGIRAIDDRKDQRFAVDDPYHFICQMKFFLFSVAFCLEARTSLHIVPLTRMDVGSCLCGPWAWPRLWVVNTVSLNVPD